MPIPAGIYLFLSGLIGLGIVRDRNDSLIRLCVYVFALLSAHSIAGTVIIDFNSIENTSNSFSGDSLDMRALTLIRDYGR